MLSSHRGLIDTFVDAIFDGQVSDPHKYLANLHLETVYSHFEKIWDIRFFDDRLSDKQKFSAMTKMEMEALRIACAELSLCFDEVMSTIKEDAVDFSKATNSQFPKLRNRALFDVVEQEYGVAFTDTSWFWRSELFESWSRMGL